MFNFSLIIVFVLFLQQEDENGHWVRISEGSLTLIIDGKVSPVWSNLRRTLCIFNRFLTCSQKHVSDVKKMRNVRWIIMSDLILLTDLTWGLKRIFFNDQDYVLNLQSNDFHVDNVIKRIVVKSIEKIQCAANWLLKSCASALWGSRGILDTMKTSTDLTFSWTDDLHEMTEWSRLLTNRHLRDWLSHTKSYERIFPSQTKWSRFFDHWRSPLHLSMSISSSSIICFVDDCTFTSDFWM